MMIPKLIMISLTNRFNQKFIKLVVVNKKDNQMFDRLLDRLYNNISVHELKILEDYSDLSHNVSDDVVEGLKIQ